MKRTIQFLFIALTLSLAACQETESDDQLALQSNAVNQSETVNPVLKQRRVYTEALNVWKSSFQTLLADGVFGGDTAAQSKFYFNLSRLQNMFNERDTVNFWIYLDNNVPMFAIANQKDSNSLLLHNGSEGANGVSYGDLKPKIDAWKGFFTTENSEYVYVKKYLYTWKDLLSSMGDNSDVLILETVAHTVEWHNPWFEVPNIVDTDGVQMEGFIVIDMLISGKEKSSNSTEVDRESNSYDFAMPCPKACLKN